MKKPLSETIQESVTKAWAEARASLQGVEDEMGRRFKQLKERADLQHGSEEVQRALSEMGRRLQQNSEALEQKLEESVRTFVSRVKTPLLDEIARLKTKAEQLGRRIESQLGRHKESSSGEQPPSTTDAPPK